MRSILKIAKNFTNSQTPELNCLCNCTVLYLLRGVLRQPSPAQLKAVEQGNTKAGVCQQHNNFMSYYRFRKASLICPTALINLPTVQ